MIAGADRAAAIYAEELAEALRRAAGRMRSEGLDDFAAALESGDYAGLAI